MAREEALEATGVVVAGRWKAAAEAAQPRMYAAAAARRTPQEAEREQAISCTEKGSPSKATVWMNQLTR